jgi:dienelactone hydrolase
MIETPQEIALNILQMARTAQFTGMRDRFLPQLRTMVTSDILRASWDSAISHHGPVVSIDAPISDTSRGGAVMVRVSVTCQRGAFTLLVAMTESGQLTGLQIAPISAAMPVTSWEPPNYADPTAFEERETTLQPGPFAVKATISMPHEPSSIPAVVLLAGSGPQDRDETLGRNKVFKDIAWGLASHGVAVLRFDKVTLVHREAVRADLDFTLRDEYVPHAVAAMRMLRQQPGVDAGRVFLLGHSLGGTVAPRVAAAEPTVAGLILMAAGAEPLHWAAVRQIRYLASLNHDTMAASEPAIVSMIRQAKLVDSPDLSPATPASDLPFGMPAAYWLDLRHYQPEEVAATIDRPILILQGGRDYQVTVAQDLEHWKRALAKRPDVTFRIYDADNHCFFSGTGPSSPAEYEPAQHVDPRVISEITDWLAAVAKLESKSAGQHGLSCTGLRNEHE